MAQSREQQPDWGAPPRAAEAGTPGVEPGETEVMARRIVAIIVDTVGANVAAFIVGLVVAGVLAVVTGGVGPGTLTVVYIVGPITVLAYFIGLEATQGQTPGKAILGIRVVRASDGGEIGWGAAAGRNLLRIVDGLFVYLVGFLVAIMNPLHQRLGDMAAGTTVIED